jgi:NAD+ kinase
MQPVSTFGVVSFKKAPIITEVLQRIYAWAQRTGTTVLFHPLLTDRAPGGAHTCGSEAEFLEHSQVLLSVGGDGTFLSVAHLCKFSKKPVVGINLGALGFLTSIALENLEADLLSISRGEYAVLQRAVLRGQHRRGATLLNQFHALNDIFINRAATPKLASVSVWYGSEFVNDYHADGIIIATPSGSTAYSLAAGGPILEPGCRVFLITPICPHSLSERPLILPDTQTIRLIINQRNADLTLSADGINTITLQPDDEILVDYEHHHVHIIQLTRHSFFESLRSKLHWGQKSLKQEDCLDS